MNLNKLPSWQKGLVLIIVITAIACLVIFQVNSSETATKTEAMLFNVLQFIFSILFAWLLSIFIGESQFIESQRKFAIGAFRRIKEIERSINRTQKYLRHLEKGADELTRSKVVAVKGGLSAMQDTVQSSIADWSDIIGDEIHITNEIKKLKNIRNDTDEFHSYKEDHYDKSSDEKVNNKITALFKSLPKEIANELDIEEDFVLEEGVDSLSKKWQQNQRLDLRCFWEPHAGFGADLAGLHVGDRLSLSRGMTDLRTGALMIFNNSDQQIAVVTNACLTACAYDEFVDAFEEFYGRTIIPKNLGGTPLTVKILEIEDYKHDKERQYLTVSVEQLPSHSCAFETAP